MTTLFCCLGTNAYPCCFAEKQRLLFLLAGGNAEPQAAGSANTSTQEERSLGFVDSSTATDALTTLSSELADSSSAPNSDLASSHQPASDGNGSVAGEVDSLSSASQRAARGDRGDVLLLRDTDASADDAFSVHSDSDSEEDLDQIKVSAWARGVRYMPNLLACSVWAKFGQGRWAVLIPRSWCCRIFHIQNVGLGFRSG